MQWSLAFDIYGTLFDPHAVKTALATRMAPSKAAQVASLWRQKQLEYSFRRGLMQRFKDFQCCTHDALMYCNAALQLGLDHDELKSLMKAYSTLPLFPDVKPALEQLARQHRLFAFSNGSQAMVQELLSHAQVEGLFEDVVSVSEVKSYKPDPKVYTHFLRKTGSDPERSWLISANCFDVIGADAVGMRTVWLKRDAQQAFDPWESQSELVVSSLDALPAQLPVR